MTKPEIIQELIQFANDCKYHASALRHEVESGDCIRQSPESKCARADILELHHKWAKHLAETISHKPKPKTKGN